MTRRKPGLILPTTYATLRPWLIAACLVGAVVLAVWRA